jgi:LysM domain.
LLKILQKKGYSGSQIQQLIPGIQSLNPHIPDVNRLMPGQVIQIPENSFTPNPSSQARMPAPSPPGSYEKMAYVVRTGDTLVQILQAKGVPRA